MVEESEKMSIEEQLLIYYVMNLTQLKNWAICTRLIKKFLETFNLCSLVFKGNVQRIKAFNTLMMLEDDAKLKAQK